MLCFLIGLTKLNFEIEFQVPPGLEVTILDALGLLSDLMAGREQL